VHQNKLAAQAPRHVIPLTISTEKHELKANGSKSVVKIRDHYMISTGFGNDDDIAAAVSSEAIQFKQCLVPYIAVLYICVKHMPLLSSFFLKMQRQTYLESYFFFHPVHTANYLSLHTTNMFYYL
jgi:hypothetical protein